MKNEEIFFLPWEYDKEQLTIFQVDTSDDGNTEIAEIANNVDPDLGKFIVTTCNAHEDLVKAVKIVFHSQARESMSVREFDDFMDALVKAGVKC